MTHLSRKQRLAVAAAVILMLGVALFAGPAFRRFELAASESESPASDSSGRWDPRGPWPGPLRMITISERWRPCGGSRDSD